MSGGPAFHGSLRPDGPSERRLVAIATVLVVALVVVAIAKPWHGPAAATLPPVATLAAAPAATSLPTAAPKGSSAGPEPKFVPHPAALTVSWSPSSAPWAGLRWQRLAPDDPLSRVTSALRWSRGYVAVGWDPGPSATPVWTSADGRNWDPLPFNTPTTFWPGSTVLGVAELRGGLVALTETVRYCGQPCSLTYQLPVISWTSPDGRAWTPHLLPQAWLPALSGQPPLVAAGPAGLVVASSGERARLATSTDGSHWLVLPPSKFPARFALDDLRPIATGYVAVGSWMTGDSGSQAASLWSSDGRQWPAKPTLLPTPPSKGSNVGSAATSLVLGPEGLIAVGRGATTPGATLWWQSRDGQRWAALPTLAPLGATDCVGAGCGLLPNGALVGDGRRLVAVRGGADARAWLSWDGRSWAPLFMGGEIPTKEATQATLLPGGVLVTDGSTTWFGEAVVAYSTLR